MKTKTIEWSVSREDSELILKIVDRAATKAGFSKHERLHLNMDITAVHANGTPLRLADLLAADDFNFVHDIGGISRHIDRDTGELRDCFLPRFAV